MQFHALLFLSGVFYCYGFNKADFFLAKDVINVETKANKNEECQCDEYFPVMSTIVRFKVRAQNDAHIVLANKRDKSLPVTEIIIGTSKNTLSVIRRDRKKDNKAKAKSKDILNSKEFRGFWVSWEGSISVGLENTNKPILSWQDDKPFSVKYFGFCTAAGSSGSWVIECMKVTKSTE